ncbi:hypothetical protein HPG69_002588 [Diceros bicornis minor]|uniref:Uncharacterized protein n=1 Tax=Diceros bicornis minor TaxID=77932 RepID=A0A7J7FP76_DICBM|nr:hypothetical protein HPG69_002588 [Diceros bicornis minor]
MASWASLVASDRVSSPMTPWAGRKLKLVNVDNFVAHILSNKQGLKFQRMEAFQTVHSSTKHRLRKMSLVTVCSTQLMRTES